MKNVFLTVVITLAFSWSVAQAVVYNGVMDNRAGIPFIPGFTGHSRAWVTGGDEGGGVRLEWQAENDTTTGLWTYTYRLLRNSAGKKGFAFFDIETAADFTTANTQTQVLSATDGSGAPIPSDLASITVSGFQNFTSTHDFTNAAVTEANSQTVLSKFDLSHYSGDPGREPTGVSGGNSSATLSVGPVAHPFSGLRVTFPGSFATLANLGYEASEWSFKVVTDRVPMWGHVFGWGDQTTLPPYWYSDFYNNHIDDPDRLTLGPADSLTGAGPYQGWVLVPGPLPTALSTLPTDTSTAVPVTEPVTAVFSGVMDPATINTATFTLAAGGVPVPGTVSYDSAANTATFTPIAPLLPDTTYTATISTGATDLAGNALTPAKVWSFITVALDDTPPAVTATLPGDGATFVAITTTVTATFSEVIEANTFNNPTAFTLTSAAGAVAGQVTFNPATRTATFTLNQNTPLANNTLYTATITTEVTDLAGNSLAAPLSWSFTTIPVETVLPMISATVPAARATSVQINTPIIAIFSERMDPATINAATFTVTGLAGSVSYDDATLTATFTPDVQPLAFSTVYRPAISTDVTDLAGNHLPLARVWSFTTAAPDTVPPTVSATSPTAGSTNVPASTVISATFSEQIDPASLGPANITVTGQSFATSAPFAVVGTVNVNSGGISLPSGLFIADGPLPMGSVYTVAISGGKDLAGNTMADRSWSFTTMPDGILTPGATTTTITDALGCLRVAVNLIPSTQDDRNHGDVAPLGPDGKPRPDGIIDIRDALVILRKVVGLVSW